MKLHLVAVGQKMPDWAETAYADYAKRFPPDCRLELKAVKTEPRTSGKPVEALMAAERVRIEAALPIYGRSKVLLGPSVAARIGLARLREGCRHFDAWLGRLERLGVS